MNYFGGLSDAYKYYEFELDALDASGAYTSTESVLNWPTFGIGGKRPLQNIAAIKILEVQIPFSWYTINAVNNTFILTENTGGPRTVTIPVGNYTSTSILPILVTALNLASAGGRTYTVTNDDNEQKLTFSNNGGSGASFSFTFGTSQIGLSTSTGHTNPRLVIGFPGGVSSSSIVAGNPQLVAPNVYSLTGANYLFVNSTSVGNLTNLFLPRGAVDLGLGNAGPQLCKIPVTIQPGGVIYWNDPDPSKWFDLGSLPSLTEIDFFLTLGNAGNVLDMNGQNFSIKLGILEDVLTDVNMRSGEAGDRAVKRVRRR